jgi:hypothetical protein
MALSANPSPGIFLPLFTGMKNANSFIGGILLIGSWCVRHSTYVQTLVHSTAHSATHVCIKELRSPKFKAARAPPLNLTGMKKRRVDPTPAFAHEASDELY